MKIITAPHPTLRAEAKSIEILDKKNIQLLKDLGATLQSHRNPRGVGLAAPQVDVHKQVFATYLNADGEESNHPLLRWFINPQVTATSTEVIFGSDPEEPALEGCLSIPGLYGPVPRYDWIELHFQTWNGDTRDPQLTTHEERFTGFAARVMQHEFDHLQGVLFTDYSLKFDLPVYQENKRTGKLDEIDKRIIESW